MRIASQQFSTGSETKDQKMVVTLARKAMVKNPNCNTQHSNILSHGYIRNMISYDRDGLVKTLTGLQRGKLTHKAAVAQALLLMKTELPLPLHINRKRPR